MHAVRGYRALLCLLLATASSITRAEELNVAVATNFLPTLELIAQRFESHSRHQVIISAASTGKLFAQIQQGAPFDIFIAADQERPALLEESGLAVKDSRFTYARGKLVLWGPQTNLASLDEASLRALKFRHLAIADPGISPYGRAAQQVLIRLGLWEDARPKLVQGEDIGQVFQFVASGNAQFGFVALTQVLRSPGERHRRYWVVPTELYDPIKQQAVLLTRAARKRAAHDFLRYLQTREVVTLISRHGYERE